MIPSPASIRSSMFRVTRYCEHYWLDHLPGPGQRGGEMARANKKRSSGRKASKRASSAKKSLATTSTPAEKRVAPLSGYKTILTDVVCLLEEARRAAARSVTAHPEFAVPYAPLGFEVPFEMKMQIPALFQVVIPPGRGEHITIVELGEPLHLPSGEEGPMRTCSRASSTAFGLMAVL